MLRSQGGCGAGVAFSTSPMCVLTRIEPLFFRILLLRRLRLPLSFRPSVIAGVATTVQLAPGLGFWKARVCSGKCCCPRVSRGWSAHYNKHSGSRHGCCPPESSRHDTFGGGRGRAPPDRRAAVGFGHHVRVEFALRRVASAWSSKQRLQCYTQHVDGSTARILSSSDLADAHARSCWL